MRAFKAELLTSPALFSVAKLALQTRALHSFSVVFYEAMDQVNVLIIGGGVVGCAIAEALSFRFQDVFLVEQFPKFGMSTSTRNSGVIHSGIYYQKNSLKARHCVEGNRMMYEFCAKHNVPHRHTGDRKSV